MNDGQFTNTSSNMAQTVLNIVEGYKMGAFRALAQEPVQNAMDAVRKGRKIVTVEYRLLRRRDAIGNPCFLLTVTDSGTTGLRGPLVSSEQLKRRHFKLKPEENWAAFEAQGYTKENEDALGSRGQGKAAFLYHSHISGEPRRMAMCYDTLLEDGEYRFGMRLARPVDQVLTPPLLSEEAIAAVQGDCYQLSDHPAIPLGLQPLDDVGTRVIVPFVNDDDAQKMKPGGELSRWLQRCWWRAIQTGKVCIRVVDDETGETEKIAAPTWWRNWPTENRPTANGVWHSLPESGRACVWSNLAFGKSWQIRRLVLLHSDSLREDEIIKDYPEYAGIQILRGSQWIETRGARQDLGDHIPIDKRPGFRGYVEFDKYTDSKLRAAENSQHDGFDARGNKGEIVRELREQLGVCMRDFSAKMGWESATAITSQRLSKREKSTHARLLEIFVNPNGRKPAASAAGNMEGRGLFWDCRLDLDYPDAESARVDWGQSLRNVYVEVTVEPGEEMIGSADLILEWLDAAGNAREICKQENAIAKQWGKDRIQERFELGDWRVLRGKATSERQIECPEPGECRLRVVIEYRGGRVKRAERTVYVQAEPPPPPQKNPVTLSISAKNNSVKDKKRIDHGEELLLQINARNLAPQAATYRLTARLGNEILVRDLPVELDGTPLGDTPRRRLILPEKLQLLDPYQSVPLPLDGAKQMTMPESSGRHMINAELANDNGERIVASCPVYFQRDPGNAVSKLPFEIEEKRDQKAMWLMNAKLDQLTYPADYPLYKEMNDVSRQKRALQGRLAFISEITANGLLEWALRPIEDKRDGSNYDRLYDENRGTDDELWDDFNRGLEKLVKMSESPIAYAQAWRKTVAVMLQIFAKEDA